LSSDSTIATFTSGSSSSSVSAATSSFGRRQVLDDVGDVRRMELGEALVGDLQLDAPCRVGLEQIDELPRDHARRDLLEQCPQRERRDQPFRQPADRTTRPDVHRDDVQQQVAVDRRRLELDVVDADHLAAVDVDDLLVEEVALQQQHAVGRRKAVPVARLGHRPHRRAGALDLVVRQHPLAFSGLDDQERNAGWMILRGDGDLAHAAAHHARGVANGGSEQLGQRDDRHPPIVACRAARGLRLNQCTCAGTVRLGRHRRNT
jgi:hypothetical protein